MKSQGEDGVMRGIEVGDFKGLRSFQLSQHVKV